MLTISFLLSRERSIRGLASERALCVTRQRISFYLATRILERANERQVVEVVRIAIANQLFLRATNLGSSFTGLRRRGGVDGVVGWGVLNNK